MRDSDWIYTRDGDYWRVLPSGMLRLDEAPAPPKLSWWERFVKWLRGGRHDKRTEDGMDGNGEQSQP